MVQTLRLLLLQSGLLVGRLWDVVAHRPPRVLVTDNGTRVPWNGDVRLHAHLMCHAVDTDLVRPIRAVQNL